MRPRAFRLTHQFRSVRQKKRTAHAIRPHKDIRQRGGNTRLSAPRRHDKQRFPPILSPECFTNRLNGAQLIIAPGDIRIDGNVFRIALRSKALEHPLQIALRIKPGNNALAFVAIRTNPRLQTIGKKNHRTPPEPALQRIRVFPRLKPPDFLAGGSLFCLNHRQRNMAVVKKNIIRKTFTRRRRRNFKREFVFPILPAHPTRVFQHHVDIQLARFRFRHSVKFRRNVFFLAGTPQCTQFLPSFRVLRIKKFLRRNRILAQRHRRFSRRRNAEQTRIKRLTNVILAIKRR